MEYKTNGLMQMMELLPKTSLIPNGAIDYSLWEWIDFNGDIVIGEENIGELNAAGLETQKF
jgi:hypothetical protein